MTGIKWVTYIGRRLSDVWAALPDGMRLRIAMYGAEFVDADGVIQRAYSQPLAEANALAYWNRIIMQIRQEDNNVLCTVSRTDGAKLRKPYRIPTYRF